MTSQEIAQIYADHRRAQRQVHLFSAGVAVLLIACLVGLTFWMGKGAMETYFVEHGLCEAGDCAETAEYFYTEFAAITGHGQALVEWCAGTQELQRHAKGRAAIVVMPLSGLLQLPCGDALLL